MNAAPSLARALILVKPGAFDRLALRAFVRSAAMITRPKVTDDFSDLCAQVEADEPLQLVLLTTDISVAERRQIADLVRQRSDRPALLRYGQFSLIDIATDLRVGYSGHLARSVELDQLIPALQFVMAGNRYVSPELLMATAGAHLGHGRSEAHRPQTGPAGHGVELTPRHREVLHEICQGATNLQIAQRLGISEATAKVHVHRILRLLGAGNRTEAARKAREMGLLETGHVPA